MTPARPLLLACLLPLAACGGGAEATPLPAADAAHRLAADVATALAESVTVDAPLALPAQLHVERDAWVVARAAGAMEAIERELGAEVAAGATLARIESVDQRLALERAEVEHAAAERQAVRARALTRAGGVTAADSELADVALRRAAIALAEARRALAHATVAAPFAGVVASRRARAGQLVRPGDTLFRLVERGPLLARAHVPEALAATLRPGATARVTSADGATAVTTTATVLRLAPAVDAASGTREAVLRVVPRPGLLPGSAVLLRLGGTRRRALAVPRSAVGVDGYALVLQGGRPTLRAVLVGDPVGDDLVEVLGGLTVGERIARAAP